MNNNFKVAHRLVCNSLKDRGSKIKTQLRYGIYSSINPKMCYVPLSMETLSPQIVKVE